MTRLLLMTFVAALFLTCGQGCTPTVETKVIEKDAKPENVAKPPPIPPPPKKSPV